jgi:SAM-dependent MidA family methyltransferase
MSNEKPQSDLIAVLRDATDEKGQIDYPTFVTTTLYAPEVGYYSTSKMRVGRSPESDFYTAQSLGPIFGQLVVAACESLLGDNDPNTYTFVEIAAEPNRSVLQGVEHNFGATKTIRLFDSLDIPPKAIVFANEWLDAQPFRRFRFDKDKGWLERGVELTESGIQEIDLHQSDNISSFLKEISPETPHDYLLDLPTGAKDALVDLCSKKWNGLFLTFDYGLSLKDFTRFRPEGVARAYERHRLSDDLLASPGEQDITCHVCWDMLEAVLMDHGFSKVQVERQESFLLGHASSACEAIVTGKRGEFDPDRLTLMELLHPANMGAKFQALRGIRAEKL